MLSYVCIDRHADFSSVSYLCICNCFITHSLIFAAMWTLSWNVGSTALIPSALGEIGINTVDSCLTAGVWVYKTTRFTDDRDAAEISVTTSCCHKTGQNIPGGRFSFSITHCFVSGLRPLSSQYEAYYSVTTVRTLLELALQIRSKWARPANFRWCSSLYGSSSRVPERRIGYVEFQHSQSFVSAEGSE